MPSFFAYRIDPENVVDQDRHAIANVILVHVHVTIVEKKIHANVHDHVHVPKTVIVVVKVVEKRKNLDIKHYPNFSCFLNLVLLYVCVIVMHFKKNLETNQ